jgi:hypothetical protein
MLIALAVLATPVLAQERLAHALGEIDYLASPTGVLIAAPHGTYDANTAPLAIAVARKLGAGYVVARRFTVDGTRINVNRPRRVPTSPASASSAPRGLRRSTASIARR